MMKSRLLFVLVVNPIDVTKSFIFVDFLSSANTPLIHDKKARIDQLHACAISWNLFCDITVEFKMSGRIYILCRNLSFHQIKNCQALDHAVSFQNIYHSLDLSNWFITYDVSSAEQLRSY